MINKNSSIFHRPFRITHDTGLMRFPFPRLFCALFLALAASAEPMKVGDSVKTFTAKDQHGQDFELKGEIEYLLVSFDMSTGKKANAFLEGKGAAFLDTLKAVYVSNIHGMPAVGRFFAMPKMRKYPHRIILADSEDLLRDYPTEKDRVTVLALDPNLKITAIYFWDPSKDLPAELKK
jgi:hypothetical protein